MPRPAQTDSAAIDAIAALEVTAALTDFVRQELRRYRNATLEDRRIITVAVLAGRILASDERLDFSPETLRRFLNGEKQNTGPDIIRAIAAFLVEEEWLTPADLEAAGQKPDMRAAYALAAFFGIKDTDKNREFYRTLSGTYRQYLMATDRLVRIDCRVSSDPDSGVLSILETTRQFDIEPGTALAVDLAKTPQAVLINVPYLERRLASQAKPVGAPLSASGFGLSDHRLLAFFLTDMRTGMPRLYDILSVSFDRDDKVIGLSGHCGAGWQAHAFAIRGPGIEEGESPRMMETTRALARAEELGAARG